MKQQTEIIKYRGAIYPEKIILRIKKYDYSWISEQKMGYYLSYETGSYQLHAVDRFASFPLFYTIRNNKLIVSEKVDDLIPYLPSVKFNPIGYYGTGGYLKGERSNHTPFCGIERIPPGHYLEYKNSKITLLQYWNFIDLKGQEFKGKYEEACEELSYLIRQSVKRCYEFAPNAAVHLSGGIDSGSITAIICQLSNKNRQSYAILDYDAPLNHDTYESGFIGKYKQHFPQLQVKRFHPIKIEKQSTLFHKAGNWHALTKENIENSIAKDTQSRGEKIILTGLGGDELASYGHGFQNVKYSIYNDQQAKLYTNWVLKRMPRWKNYLKGLFGRDGNIVDSLYSTYLSNYATNKSYWYTQDFKESAEKLFNKPNILLYCYPSAYDYRLETLDRSFFTIRSDKWNFIGEHLGVDYLHPLLDTDLITFCARLPRAFFQNRKHREMIKTALKSNLPEELILGGKRPIYTKQIFSKEDLIEQIQQIQILLEKHENTFASTIYDYKKMEYLINLFKAKIEKSPFSYQQIFYIIYVRLKAIYFMIQYGKYLNTFFSK